MKLKLLSLILIGILFGCSTGVYLKPTSTQGHLSFINPACPGAEEVIEFSPKQIDWVQIRIYALLPGRDKNKGTEMHIDVLLKPGLGFPLFTRYGEEFERRSKLSYSLKTDSPNVTLIQQDGTIKKLTIKLFEEERPFYSLWSQNRRLAKETIILSNDKIDKFSIEFPKIYINGELLEIPKIYFELFEDRYFPVLNC